MCTLIVAHRLFDGFPVVVAANRDELLDRPSELPCIRGAGIFAPKDLQRGGSWIGVNEQGVFAALTNRSHVKSKPDRESRGDLIMQALQYGTAKSAFEDFRLFDGKRFNGFNLVIADKNRMYLLRGNGVIINSFLKSDQLLLATNVGVAEVDDLGPDRCKNIFKVWHKNSMGGCEPTLEVLSQLLDIHNPYPHGTCIYEPSFNYGTKSSSVIRLREVDNEEWEYWHRERTSTERHICEEVFGPKMTVRIR
ncbi:MAG: hypothetical protein A3B86_02520 [Candidatus Yanofskybacteria bacterium RIFCSPHIGHO2_02_FULL_38_22b]|uniref:NRDE family protein n=1 Tax=Candidatus Yanofskybacteria bacterium RIFCSPHIGHO2_02_FULL_38_22b TaxID=1802673 RepID=A0A1F8F5Z9_9BACT|nr:MAG: hypothetical protein A3B86_02520 [Candidatus Yanofskybacteria bacterium RIFCSPHIGHO2_02_FULL_38_22b]OGN20318.1 MAG: hypothetical protein A2910_03355 [Candidatus Yanofskybacteria bacterium RIFCSPLOWO2_01_FULL_39_28]